MQMPAMPSFFLSHGGGPWPYMKDTTGHLTAQMEAALAAIPASLPQPPRAVLIASGHWESQGFAVSAAARPPMVFDYYGFPEHTYRISYPAPGAPELAQRVAQLLAGGGLTCRLDPERGFDHGTFSLMTPMYPDAGMPCVQIALDAGMDAALHLRAGQLLAPLREEGVVIIGSGSSYHNLAAWRSGSAPGAEAFDAWLNETLTAVAPAERLGRLRDWTAAPAARAAHPREEHLLPLMLAAGAAGAAPGSRIYHEDRFMGAVPMSSFRFG